MAGSFLNFLVQSVSEKINSAEQPLSGRELLIASLILCGFAVLLFIPTFIKGFPSGHDAYVHYRWAVQFNEALKEPGVWYPRWLPAANHQQGSPVMLYYPPLPCFVTAFFQLFTSDALRALMLASLMALLLSGIAMYLFCRSLFSPRVSLFAAGVYLLAPYHLYDFYHRSALSEFWAFVWLPLILDAIYRIITTRSWRMVVYLTVSYTLLLLSHVPVAFAFSLVLPIYILILTRNRKDLLRIASGLMMGVGLSAVFVLPVLLERKFVRIERVLGIRYTKYWVFEQIFETPFFHLPDQRRFFVLKMVDLTALALLFVLLLSLIVWLIVRKRANLTQAKNRVFLAGWIIALLCLLLTTNLTAFVWEAVPPLQYLQFPFRWLTIVTLFAALLLAAMISLVAQISKAKWLFVLLLAVILLSMSFVSLLVIKETTYDREEIVKKVNALEAREYYTIWQPSPRRAEEEDEANPDALPLPAVTVTSGNAEVEIEDGEGVTQHYRVRATEESWLQFRALYFPGWRATINHQRAGIEAGENGNIVLKVPAGDPEIGLQFRDTRPRWMGKIISAIFVLLCLALLWKRKSTNNREGFYRLKWFQRKTSEIR